MYTIIAAHFNFLNSTRMVENFKYWQHKLGKPVLVGEARLDGNFQIPGSIRFQATEKNILWQKEAILNVLFDKVKTPYVAWLDQDVIFDNPHALDQAALMLSYDCDAVQLYHRIDIEGREYKAAVYSRYLLKQDMGCPGGAWMAKTEFMQKYKLFPYHVIGGGDRAFSDAVLHQRSSLYRMVTPRRLADLGAGWRAALPKELVADYVRGKLTHLTHGSTKNRKYQDRHKIIAEFDPVVDVTLDKNGLLSWTNDKYCQGVKEYFLGRREDD